MPGTLNFQRTLTTEETIGLDKNGNPVNTLTVITDPGGNIVTAFPGLVATDLGMVC